MARRDYLNDPEAPKANSIVPAASAIVTDRSGRILLHRRSDNDLWGLPGGGMELGESISQTIVREVREETGLDVEPRYVIGIYTNPRHVIAFADGEVRQGFLGPFCVQDRRRRLASQRRVVRAGLFFGQAHRKFGDA